MAVDIAYDVPVIGAEAFRRIIGKPAFGFAVDGDAVVIVKPISLPSPSVPASEQASWEILHQTAIAHEHPGVMVNDLMAGAIKLRRQRPFGDGHPDGVRQPLAQRAGGGFHPRV